MQINQIELYSFQWMPNHYRLGLRPLIDGEMRRFMGWVGSTHTMRAELLQRAEHWRWSSLWRWLRKPEPNPPRLSLWPRPRLSGWTERVNASLSQPELATMRLSGQRGKPLGDEGWVESIARRLNLESTMRPRGRKRVRLPKTDIKEA